MDKFDKVMLWIKQIVINLNVTATNAVDCLFTPIYGIIDFVWETAHQWATKPNTEQPNNEQQHHIGFNR